MKRIASPQKGMGGYNCFGCAPSNEAGMKMKSYEEDDEVISIQRPCPEYQGWIDMLHGGIRAVLLGEVYVWMIPQKLQTIGVTPKMETRYRKSISTNDSHAAPKAHIKGVERNIVLIEARFYNRNEELCMEAICAYSTFPKEKVKEEMHSLSYGAKDEEILPPIRKKNRSFSDNCLVIRN